MTRQLVYGVSLWVFLATIAMTLAAIIIPDWIVWDAYPEGTRSWFPEVDDIRGPAAKHVHYTYGLHSRCDSITESCTPFPQHQDCAGLNRQFCSLWRTMGFFMSAAVVMELAGLVSFAIIILGGKQKRDRGWKMLALILGLCVLCQCTSMGIAAALHSNDDHFFPGWYLARSWILCTVSWCLQLAVAVGLVGSAFLLPEEGGYELIPDRERTD